MTNRPSLQQAGNDAGQESVIKQQLLALQAENQKLRKINQALIERVEAGQNAVHTGPYAAFQHAAVLAEQVAKELLIPVIGIGAGGGVDGQVLVLHDMLGVNQEFSPRFLRRYHNLYAEMFGAIGNYVNDVKSQDFPNESESY